MDVEDLLQKHSMLESEMGIIGERIKNTDKHAQRFMDPAGPDQSGYKPVDPDVVKERINHLEDR